MSRHMIIRHASPDVRTAPTPWPIGLEEQRDRVDSTIARWVVTSGLGPDDGSVLVGFGPLGKQQITVMPEDAVNDPASVVGLAASFSDGSGFFEWKIPIAELTDL